MAVKKSHKDKIDKPQTRKKRGEYDDKLQVKEGETFTDLVNVWAKNANDNSAHKKEAEKNENETK
jgi:hypothetical protein